LSVLSAETKPGYWELPGWLWSAVTCHGFDFSDTGGIFKKAITGHRTPNHMPALIIHGHFYQPPRENPWTDIVEVEPSATPFHDWNERIHSECYQPNAGARITDAATGAELIVNNYEHVSFNFGPTLLSWLESNHPATYASIIDADHQSALARGGHGNAIAQAYGHAILPLCNEHDRRTQIRWGIADFRHRFGRDPEAMWLPETACNDAVMGMLIDARMRFVILAPNQAARIKATSETEWHAVNQQTIDTGIPYHYSHVDGSGRSILVFFYDGPTSRAIAFENLLKSSRELVDRFEQVTNGRALVNVATDGETYGHHFKFGDIGLAHAVAVEAPARGLQVTNYGEYLDRDPPTFEVELDNGPEGEGTSWSCQHGVGRWIRDCGCHTGGEPGWNQKWRTPLRRALDFLRDENAAHFEATRGHLFIDPWQARDESIALILDQYHSREQFLGERAGRWLSTDEQSRALTHLELQRMLLLMYTSCGWFFNDISGIETIQILKYAGRAIDLMQRLSLPSVRDCFLEILAEAKSNRTSLGSGADIYLSEVEPLRVTQSKEDAFVT
jgi:alpha-amylase/alpha-mannosidase (GH57 family)